MATLQDATQLLHDTEARLRGMIAEAAAGGDYTAAAEIATLAGALRGLTADPEAAKRAPSASSGPASAAHAAPSKAPVRTSRAKQAATPARKPAKRGAKGDYPRFYRDGDRLVKVAWSKKNRDTYEHRAPKAAVLAFASHLAANVKPGQVFRMEDILPVSDPQTGDEIPAYQLYLALGWMRQAGAVEKKGRDAYLLREATPNIEEFWSGLALR